MTSAPAPLRGRLSRLGSKGRSVALYVVGILFDVVGVINVPGAAVFVDGPDPVSNMTKLGVVFVPVVLACWLSVFLRTRAPLAPLISGGVLVLVGTSYVLALIGAYHALVTWRAKTRLIAMLMGAGVLFYVLRDIVTPWGGALAWMLGNETSATAQPVWHLATVIFAVLSLGLVAGLVAYQRARTEASTNQQRADREAQRAGELGEQVERQAERERIARDLHDGLGHRLSSVALAAGAFEAHAAGTADPMLTDWAKALRQQAHAALEDVRDVVGALRTDATGAGRPVASLRMVGALLVDLRTGGHRLDQWVLIEDLERISLERDAAAFRIIQECLTNAIKHAPGAPIAVTVDAAVARGIRIRVTNPLTAGNAGIPGGGHGIAGLRARAESVGGTAWIGEYEGEFIADFNLPWAER
ncbi:MAG TPA: histidine kinase [Candidatus Lumbricidophila sp.]|nr:histidine kinase [Candidatus Lumbricidophila sp.]